MVLTFFRYIGNIFVEALFPHSPIERELFSLPYEQVISRFPPAPSYNRLAVPLPESHSLFAYKNQYVETLIWNIKYKKSIPALTIAGKVLRTHISQHYSKKNILLIPMPSSTRRRRERGFNQCECIIDAIGNEFPHEYNLLTRPIHHDRHTLKGRADRLGSAHGIFSIDQKVLEKLLAKNLFSHNETHIIVIDDVITTGSTMREAIDTLKNAGFKDVSGLSLAH